MGRLQPPRTSGYATDSVYASSCTLAIVLLGSVEEKSSAWGRGEMIPEPMDFRGPIMGPVGFRRLSRGLMGFGRPIEMTLKNQYVEDQRAFFWGGEITSQS